MPGTGEDSRYPIEIVLKEPTSETGKKEIKIIPVIKDKEKDVFVQCIQRQLVIDDYNKFCNQVKSTTAIPHTSGC